MISTSTRCVIAVFSIVDLVRFRHYREYDNSIVIMLIQEYSTTKMSRLVYIDNMY